MALPSTLEKPSSRASATVGWAWMVNIISSTVASSSIAVTRFGDDLRRVRADDVDAENLAVLGVGDDLDEAVVRVEDGGLGVADEGELADLDLVALLLGLRLGQADAARSADRSRCSPGCVRG